ncbi:MAG: hypothetical protein PHY72_03070 [Candidatus Pacebacteria bacterium]|nr:hypothetical protein [Candidatus Paceibacterota bacterium]
MIYLLYGPDEYRLIQKLSEAINQYAKKYGSSLVLERIDLLSDKDDLFWEVFYQNSLFVSKKVFILENVFLNSTAKKCFLKKIKKLAGSGHIIFFIERKEIKKNDPFFVALKANGKIQEFLFLSGKKLEAWAKEQFILAGSVISEKALSILLTQVKNDMWLLCNEIKKLSAFKKEIIEKDVYILSKPNIEMEIFKTIEAILSSNKKEALKALQNYFNSQESLFYLSSMLASQARNLLLVKASQNQGNISFNNLDMHPFVFKKSVQAVRNVPIEKLKVLMQKIFLADLEIKTGLKSPEQSVKFLVASI